MKKITKDTYYVFWSHARSYRGLIFLIVFPIAAEGIVRTVIPLFYKRFFDTLYSGAQGSPVELVHALTIIIVAILALDMASWLFHRVEATATNTFTPRVWRDLTNTCFSYLHRHSYGFFAGNFVGSLVRRVNKLADAFEGISERMFSDILPIVIRISAIIIILSWRRLSLGLMLLGWVAAYMAINYAFTLYKLKHDRAFAAADSEITGRLADTITNNVNLKVFTGLADELTSFRRLTDNVARLWKRVNTLNEVISAVQAVMMIGINFVIFFYAIRFWAQGFLTVGDFALIQAYLLQVFDRLWGLGRIIRRIYKHMADSEEMVAILNTPHEITDKPTAQPFAVRRGQIEFRHVTFRYNKTRSVLDDFNLVIEPGEKVGLVGLSGTGKSTIAALMLRFFDVADGAILIDGQNIADVMQDSLRDRIGYVPQDPILFHRTLKENIRYGKRDASDEDVITASAQAHCHEFISALPHGYDTYVGERGIKLSGGERQRVAIARAILKNAPLLVLDEATSSLDSQAESAIQSALENLMKNKTSLVIAHRLSTIMKMDRIIVMHEGAIVEQGRHDALVEKPDGIYRKLWQLQAGGFVG